MFPIFPLKGLLKLLALELPRNGTPFVKFPIFVTFLIVVKYLNFVTFPIFVKLPAVRQKALSSLLMAFSPQIPLKPSPQTSKKNKK